MISTLSEIIIAVIISVTSAILLGGYVKNSAKNKKRDRVIFKSLLALLICQRDGKCNGELKEALEELNDFLIEK